MESIFEKKAGVLAPDYPVIAPDLAAIKATGLPDLAGGWCVWLAKPDSSRPKPQKIPYGLGGRSLKVSESESWLSFEQAAELYATGGWDGFGLLMSAIPEGTDICGLDLDKCLDESGAVLPEKAEIVSDFIDLGGYIEVSPSGRGLRQFLDGARLDGYLQKTAAHDLEVYDRLDVRYLTVTGRPWPIGTAAGSVMDAAGSRNNQAGLTAFIEFWCGKEQAPPPLQFDPDEWRGVDRSVDAFFALLKRNNQRGKITRLLVGDCAEYGGDHSAADAALCQHIAFYTRNPKTIDAVFRRSGLMREKWDERRGRELYGQRTIRKALDWQRQFYDADARNKSESKAKERKQEKALNEKAEGNLIGGVSDLMAKGGKGFRRDVYVLSELLIRDRRLLGVCYFDLFSGYVIFNRNLDEALADKAAPRSGGRMTDRHIGAFCRWFGKEWELDVKFDQAAAAITAWANCNAINPVKDRLETLAAAWDGKPRVGGWLASYCKAIVKTEESWDISDYVSAVGLKWLVSAVARAYTPGCKVDTILILQGKQGAKKSSMLRVLAEALGAEYFREGFRLTGSKDTEIALRGRLVIEWTELAGQSKRDRDELKNFLSLQTDAYRQPFGKLDEDFPRTAVFAGTTNEAFFLSDPTGNRRIWPVTVGAIDLGAIRRDAGQLWGEAVHLYRNWQAGDARCRWWFDDADPRDQRLLVMAEMEQQKRLGSTFFGELAADMATRMMCGMLREDDCGVERVALPHKAYRGEQVRQWLKKCGGGDAVSIDDSNWYRVCEGLRQAGWESKKSNGVMKWFLTDERQAQWKLMQGLYDEPKINPFSLNKRNREAA